VSELTEIFKLLLEQRRVWKISTGYEIAQDSASDIAFEFWWERERKRREHGTARLNAGQRALFLALLGANRTEIRRQRERELHKMLETGRTRILPELRIR